MNISDNKRVLLDLKTTQQVDEITYEDLTDKNPRERRLCSNCNSYDREKSFNDGNHSIIFRAIKDDKVADEENVSFFIDSKSPRISTTKPSRRKYTNGSDFYLKYTEDNCQSLKLEIQGYSNSVAYAYACESGKNIEKTILQNLSAFNGETIEYTFTITDIAENTDSKTVSGVYVDTSPPVLNNPDSFWTRGEGRYSNYIYFDMSITEKNFDEVVLSYDYRGKTREKRLCSRLKDGKCEYKFKLSDAYSNLRLIIRDEAGNSAQEEIDFGG